VPYCNINRVHNFFRDNGKIDVTLEPKSELITPSAADVPIRYDENFWNEIRDYINILIYRWEIVENPVEDISLLIGISQIKGFEDRYGVTIPKERVQNNIPVSFIFKSNLIKKGGTSESLGSRTELTILHELCHARGMNLSTNYEILPQKNLSEPFFDHVYHHGHFSDRCIMHKYVEIDPPLPFELCDYHKRVLQNCLQQIKPTYSIYDTCCGPWMIKK
jgi:hypothetical protein